jgi:hypothetical protein
MGQAHSSPLPPPAPEPDDLRDAQPFLPRITSSETVTQLLDVMEDIQEVEKSLHAEVARRLGHSATASRLGFAQWLATQSLELNSIRGDLCEICSDLLGCAPLPEETDPPDFRTFETLPLPGESKSQNPLALKANTRPLRVSDRKAAQ